MGAEKSLWVYCLNWLIFIYAPLLQPVFQVQALQKTYVIDVVKDGEEKMNFNIPAFRRALGSLRLLQKVGMGREEEQVLKDSLKLV